MTLCQKNLACLRDYYITADKTIALASLKATEELQILREITEPGEVRTNRMAKLDVIGTRCCGLDFNDNRERRF